MRNLLIAGMLLINVCSNAQTQDSVFTKAILRQSEQIASLKNQVDQLSARIADINNRTERFASTNNFAALFYFGGLAIAAINAASDEPADVVYYVAGGMAFIGTVTLYFSANSLKVKRHHNRETSSQPTTRKRYSDRHP